MTIHGGKLIEFPDPNSSTAPLEYGFSLVLPFAGPFWGTKAPDRLFNADSYWQVSKQIEVHEFADRMPSLQEKDSDTRPPVNAHRAKRILGDKPFDRWRIR